MFNPINPLSRFSDIAEAGNWTSLFPALADLCQSVIGYRLFSCSRFQLTGAEGGVAARVYTSDEVNYPTSGLKQIVPNRWTRTVIDRRAIFVANSVDGFSDVFPDHELIASLGLESVINVPVVLRGEFVGTINMLHGPGYYDPDKTDRLHHLRLPALLAFGLTERPGESAQTSGTQPPHLGNQISGSEDPLKL